jgi:thioesterase domain-containing protein
MMRAQHITKFFIASITAFLITACLAGPCEAASRGHAYLFRGLIGMIDWGMDQLAKRIERGGVTATIDSHLTWRAAAENAIAEYRRSPEPITAIGHSIGGDSAVEFAEKLAAAHVPVALLITYDPTRMSHRVPANVERYINLYQSSNILGGGDLGPGGGFHGNYASYNLKERAEVIHINLDKFDRIQEQLASKIRSLAATPAHGEGEVVPLRIVIPPSVAIELWDSGVPVTAQAGDTVQSLAAAHHVPVWAIAQINKIAENAALTEGKRIIVPRYLGPRR